MFMIAYPFLRLCPVLLSLRALSAYGLLPQLCSPVSPICRYVTLAVLCAPGSVSDVGIERRKKLKGENSHNLSDIEDTFILAARGGIIEIAHMQSTFDSDLGFLALLESWPSA
ncbi:hypothetical protein FIBSPDRAFT_952665 [Athelia psychrophila]|uniref:Secreted protein n=1 Tax=Athelia psychrophila TaxID=1759441 RepID=A0A166L3I4_9AGAM|nr:hypothetical protein FIBSPDRAFT_952665 [Fibularhizoctonia sp. CBS 109695]